MGSNPLPPKYWKKIALQRNYAMRHASVDRRPLEHGQKLLKCQEMSSDGYKMQENAWRPRGEGGAGL